MELYNATGVAKTGNVQSAKPIASLLIGIDDLFANLADELITVFIERAGGSNKEIATSIPLQDFILLSVYGLSAIYHYDGKLWAKCELTPGGAIQLAENERVKFSIEGLNAAKTYVVNGLEEFANTTATKLFERKTVLAGEPSRFYDVDKFEAVCISNYAQIKELSLTFDNGQTCKYTLPELVALSVDTDPIQEVGKVGDSDLTPGMITTFFTDKIVLPLLGVTRIEIVKTENQAIPMTFSSVKY